MVAATKQAPPSRMRLDALEKGRKQEPISVLLYGVEGIGKSTFGADAPRPVFIDGEGGTSELDVTRFPRPAAWPEVLEAVRTLTDEGHDFGTLVVDTLDWLEPMLWEHICKRDQKKDIEDYGFGKGYVAALDEWRVFLAALERLQEKRRMHVVLLAHSWVKSFKNPEGNDFDRYELKLNAKAGGLMKEWPKAVLFANYETIAAVDAKTKRAKGVSTGARLIYTTRTAAYDAKNRYSLPESLPLSWAEFFRGTQVQQVAEPKVLVAEIERKAKVLDGEDMKKVRGWLEQAGQDAEKLAKLNSHVNAMVNEKETGNV